MAPGIVYRPEVLTTPLKEPLSSRCWCGTRRSQKSLRLGSRLSGHHVRNRCRAQRSPRWATGLCGEQYLDTCGELTWDSRKLSRSIRLPSAARPRAWCIFVELELDAESRLQRPMRISVRTGLSDLQEDRRPTICSRCPEDPERGCNIKEAIPVLAMSGRPRRGTIRRGRCRRAAAVLVMVVDGWPDSTRPSHCRPACDSWDRQADGRRVGNRVMS